MREYEIQPKEHPVRDFLAIVFLCIIGIGLLFGIIWAVQGNSFFLYQYFAPKEEAVRRQTFEQSKAYNQGMAQELDNMRMEYARSTPEQRTALGSIILHRAADYDETKLTPNLREFIDGLRQQRYTNAYFPTTQP